MTDQPLMSHVDGLVRSIKLAAAVAAAARLGTEPVQPDDTFTGLLMEAGSEATEGTVANASAAELSEAASYIRTQLRQALELIENPASPGGWRPSDLALIDSQGKASQLVIREIEAFAQRRASLDQAIWNGRRALDVGTGAGWIAIEAARRWTGMEVTGIDIWEPALDLARSNVRASGLSDRIQIENADIAALESRSRFDLVWLPAPFLPEDVLKAALPRIWRALVPGGSVVIGTEREPRTSLDRLLAQIDSRRMGGHCWKDGQLLDALSVARFEELEEFSLVEPLLLVAGRRPS